MIINRLHFSAFVLALLLASGVERSFGQSTASDQIIDRVFSQEQSLMHALPGYTPLVETYIQNLESDHDLGTTPKSDNYYLGKLTLAKGVNQASFLNEGGFAQSVRAKVRQLTSVKYVPEGFAQMIIIDSNRFDRAHYNFEYARREFIGEVRCLVFDVSPKDKNLPGAFLGRVWVEDRDYHIVRFNGTYVNAGASNLYFHFDSWREQMGPGLWLPAYVYTEESDRQYLLKTRKLQFKAQTRIWGYNVGHSGAQKEFTSLSVESNVVDDHGDAIEQSAPVLGLRTWERQAEENVLERMEKAGLLAPAGSVDKVLETVVNNLEATNDLSIDPEVRCRVLLTSPLESFTIGHTIVLSRGLIDVLPDEASLAMILAHELGHIAAGHRLDTKYAFNDRMLFEDHETFYNVFVKRDEIEEKQADQKAIEFLNKSPYKDKLASAGLFLRALSDKSTRLPNLLTGTMGNRIAVGGNLLRMPELMQIAPQLEPSRVDQLAALPLGGRVRVDPWSNTIELVKGKSVTLLSAGEKLQFEIAPIFLYLTRQGESVASRSRND